MDRLERLVFASVRRSRRPSLLALGWKQVCVIGCCVFACGPRPLPQATAASPPKIEIDEEELLSTRVDTWEPHDMGRAPSSLEHALTERVDTALGGEHADDAYACLAREVAAVFARYRALPDETFKQWLAGSCGAPWGNFRAAWLEFDETALGAQDGTFAAILERVVGSFVNVARQFRGFGIGTHARAGKIVAILVVDTPALRLRPAGPDSGGIIHIEGRVFDQRDVLRAAITQGATGSARCRTDNSVELPFFDVDCQMADEDAEAWIEIIAGNGSDLEGPVGAVLVRRPTAARSYRRPRVRLPKRPTEAAALLDGINALRVGAGIAPLRAEAGQSRLGQTLYKSLFEADIHHDYTTKEQLGDELLAGKSVEGVVHWASLFAHIAYAGTASDWLARLLALPTGREFLLNPQAESAALMTRDDPSVGFGAALVLYSLYHDSEHQAVADHMFDRLQKQRAKHGLKTNALAVPAELTNAAARLPRGETTPIAALQAGLAAVNATTPRLYEGVSFVIPYNRPPPDLPQALLRADVTEFAVAVSHYREPEARWGELVVFVIFPAPRGQVF